MKRQFAVLAAVGLVLVMLQTGVLAKGPAGLKGTITAVGSSGFEMSIPEKSTSSTSSSGSSTTYDVLCDAHTKFLKGGGGDANPTDIAVGASVAIVGNVVGPNELHASQVTIIAAKKKAK